MKVSHRWLQSLTGLDASAEEIGDRLTRAGVECESIRRVGGGLDRVVVATVRAAKPHPAQGRLTLVTVDDGAGGREVVCGAPNVPAVGRQVLLALVGARLPSGALVEARKIAGIESRGMLASEAELDIGGDADGIVVIEETEKPAAAGTPALKALPVEDSILELGLTPNRADCLGHHGVAREILALFGGRFDPPEPDTPPRVTEEKVGFFAEVRVEDSERCPRYGGAVVTGLQAMPSPFWLRYRLHTLGIRAISNLVDVTNLVLLEYGQPLHAFDLDRVVDRRIVVRRANAGEKMKTLDGVLRTFTDDDLLICDGEGPVAIAGIMGGERSGVSQDTKRVLLECANFQPSGIRRTARRLGLHTESSHRFERGTDVEVVPEALAHAASLVARLGGGAAAPGSLDVYRAPYSARRIGMRMARAEALLGSPVSRAEATETLERLGCVVTAHGGAGGNSGEDGKIEVAAPPFRPDLAREVDLIEEVVRVRGMDSVPTTYPAIRTGPAIPRRYDGIRQVRSALCALGLHEAISFSFVSPRELDAIGVPADLRVPLQNPLSDERSVMRTSLLPGLLAAAARSRRAREAEVRLFEVARVYLRDASLAPLVAEPTRAAALCVGERPAWLAAGVPFDLWDAKGLLDELVRSLTGQRVDLEPAADRLPFLHPRAAFEVRIEGAQVGWLGEVHPDVLRALDVLGPAVGFEVDADALAARSDRDRKVAAAPRHPAIERDVAFVLPDEVTAGAAVALVREVGGDLVESVVPFDLYRGAGVPEGRRSLALRATYRAADRTLTDAEVDDVHARVRDSLASRLGATIR